MLTKKFYPVIFMLIFSLLLNGSLPTQVQAAPSQPGAITGPSHVTTISFDQPVYFKASNTDSWDTFGSSVALSGNTFVVGAPRESSSATGVNGDQSNNSVASAGAAYVFYYDGSGWVQQAYLKASDPNMYDFFGCSVAISGDTIVVGAMNEDSSATGGIADNSTSNAGAAYVFTRSGSTWSPQGMLKASNADIDDQFGVSVAVWDNRIVVGANGESSNGSSQSDNSATAAGAAYIFEGSGSTWNQVAYLKASNAEEQDWFGYSVAVYGDMALVGAIWEDSDANGLDGDQIDNSAWDAGAAYAFYRTGSGTWGQVRYIKASNSDTNDHFGQSVSIASLAAAIGAPNESSSARVPNGNQADNSSAASGAAYLFEHIGSVFTPQVAYLKATNADANDRFGWSVAVNDWEEVLVGAFNEASSTTGVNGAAFDNSAAGAGAAYFFGFIPGTGIRQLYYLKASNTNAGDRFGFSLAASTDFIVVGADREDSIAVGLNGDREDNSAVEAGAVYIPGGLWHYNYLPSVLGIVTP